MFVCLYVQYTSQDWSYLQVIKFKVIKSIPYELQTKTPVAGIALKGKFYLISIIVPLEVLVYQRKIEKKMSLQAHSQ